MSISTMPDKPGDKREKLKKLREFHGKVLSELGVSEAGFLPKVDYVPYGKTEKHVAFFHSEISKGSDIIVEFCSKDNDPLYEDRALYRWRFNPHFDEEYEKTEPGPTGHHRYLVPVSELIKVYDYTEKQVITKEFTLSDPDVDLPIDQVTIRDIAAILLKKPVSMKPWLNEIIKSS